MSTTEALLARIRAAAALPAPGLGVDESIEVAPPAADGARAFRYRHDQDRASQYDKVIELAGRVAADGGILQLHASHVGVAVVWDMPPALRRS